MKGVSYSKSLENEEIDEEEDNDSDSDSDSYPGEEGESEDSDPDESSSDEDYDDETGEKRVRSKITPEMAMREKDRIVRERIQKGGEEAELDHLKSALLPRKKRELYKAMQIGLAKKEERAEELRKRAAELKQMARDKGGNKRVKTTKGAGGSAKKKQKK